MSVIDLELWKSKIIGFEGYLMMPNMMFEISTYHIVSFFEIFY